MEQVPADSDFEKVYTTKANNVHPVTKYRSKSTGLEVVHAEIEGPIVNGYIVLATRTDNDEGIPHTLEHLIFMGSEDYPYKGVLDVLANKCLASGTNAWTDPTVRFEINSGYPEVVHQEKCEIYNPCRQYLLEKYKLDEIEVIGLLIGARDVDHTCYTLTTAGQNGFCFLLPIYLDHVFHPILSDEAFLVEVHHVTGEGMDGGVVYSELLAKENTAEDKSHRELARAIYPPESGYFYNAGGIMKAVRESCNNEKVKKFHTKFYVPRNTRIIVCGIVEPKKLIDSLELVVKKLIAKGKVLDWKNPWLCTVPDVTKESKKNIYFGGEEGEDCLITIGMRGPCAINEVEELAALRLIFEYLTDSAVGPLQLEFVEQEEPLASNVNYGEMENAQTAFYFEFENVPVEDIDSIVPRLKTVLKKQIDSFSLDRMLDIIRTHYQEEISSMENTPHNSIAYASIADFLYGIQGDTATFDKRINMGLVIQDFLERKSSDWTRIIKERILNQKWITINARPSEKEHENWIKSEENRLSQRIKTFGEPGLTKFERQLEDAIKFNQREIPSGLLESITTPSTKAINFHRIKRYENPDFANDFGCKCYIDDIKSNFIYISIHMDTTALSNEQRKYLPLFKEALTESPLMMEDGTILPFEQVVAGLSRDLLNYGCSCGIDGSGSRFKTGAYNHIFSLLAQIQIEKAEIGFDWLRRLLFHIQWSEDRLKVLASKMASEINPMKRKGNKIAKTILKDILYKNESNTKCSSFLRQQSFLKQIAVSLPASAMNIKKMMESIRLVLTDPKNITIHIASSIKILKESLKEKGVDASGILSKTFPTSDSETTKKLSNIPDMTWMHDLKYLKENPQEFILGLKGADTGFLCQGAPGITDFNDPELAPLLLTLQYFCQSEGPFFRSIRGGGYAYGYYMDARPNEGMIYFYLTQCSNIIGAYKASQDVILSHMNGIDEWSDALILSAKSSLSFEVIEGEKTPLALASSSLCCYYRNLSEGYSRRMIERIETITKKELQEMTEKYIAPLFVTNTNCVVVVSTDQVKSVVDGLNKLGKKMKILASLNDGMISEWNF